MARHHLPFASYEETLYRAASMYALAQYFRLRAGLVPDTELQGLVGLYESVCRINRSVVERVRGRARPIPRSTHWMILDIFAQVVPESVEGDLEKLKDCSAPSWNDPTRSVPQVDDDPSLVR